MSQMTQRELFKWLLKKEFTFEDIQQDLSDRWREDEYNCEYAEHALDIACELYDDDDIDKRHEFVSDFLEYMREEVIRSWARNLGMKG